MVKEAVILAAGMGSRLGDKNDQKPKGFLKLGSQSIIEESINKLIVPVGAITVVCAFLNPYSPPSFSALSQALRADL